MSREGRIVAPATADPLDMRQYRIETLPVRAKGPIERRMAQIGIPLAVLLFVVFGFLVDLPFLQQVNPETLTSELARKEFAAKSH